MPRTIAALLTLAVAVGGAVLVTRRHPPAAEPPPTPSSGTQSAASQSAAPISLRRIPPADVRQWINAHPGAVLLDVRTPAEFAAGHVEGAVNLDVTAPEFSARAAALPRDTPYVVYCRSGARSARAGTHLLEIGHHRVVNAGAYEALVAVGFSARSGQ